MATRNRYLAETKDLIKNFDAFVAKTELQTKANTERFNPDVAKSENKQLNQQLHEKLTEYRNKILAIRHDVLGRVEDWGILRPSFITDDIKLLSYAFAPSYVQLQDIISRNRGNATMLQAIERYLKHPEGLGDVLSTPAKKAAAIEQLKHPEGLGDVLPTPAKKAAAYEQFFTSALNMLSSAIDADRSNRFYVASIELFGDPSNTDGQLLDLIGDGEELSPFKAATPFVLEKPLDFSFSFTPLRS